MNNQSGILIILLGALLGAGCTHPPGTAPATAAPADGNFPQAVASIFITRCATAGCHNEASYEGAANLRLDNWQSLFNGTANNAPVVPYSPEQSSLLYYINTNATLGPVAVPRMPLNSPALSADEYETIRAWIADGAPDKDGAIAFEKDVPPRQKIYITQQGCDLVAVVDAATRQIARQIPVGKTPGIESPHCIRVDEQGRYAYVGFLGGSYVQQINTATDHISGEAQVGNGQWNILHVSEDGTQLMAADFSNGVLKIIRTADMVVTRTFEGGGIFVNPHGIAANAAFDTFYITSQYGNVVYKFSGDGGYFNQIAIDGTNAPQLNANTEDPHEILMTPDRSKYFLTCQASNKVRVLDARTNALLATFSVGARPQEIAMSRRLPYAFITCQEDAASLPGFKGSVYVIDYSTLQFVRRIDGPFYQPHGLAVNEADSTLFIASANADTSGIAPHHVSTCAGRNGWYNVVPFGRPMPATLRRYEMAVYPYSVDSRMK